jgi:hypothetical protein
MLNTAYGDGLLSEGTLAHRLEQVFAERLIEPRALIGELNLPSAHSRCHQRLRGPAAAALAGVCNTAADGGLTSKGSPGSP